MKVRNRTSSTKLRTLRKRLAEAADRVREQQATTRRIARPATQAPATPTTTDTPAVPVVKKGRLIGMRRATWDEWSSIPDNPVQRDTERHAKIAEHLWTFCDGHLVCAVAILPDGSEYKTDGHTRDYCWRNGMTEGLPEALINNKPVLYVAEYACDDLKEVEASYGIHDNKNAVETMPDMLHGALRKARITLQSPVLRQEKFSSALCRAYVILFGGKSSKANIYDVVSYFRRELVLLDRCEFTRGSYTASALIAALFSFMHDDAVALNFWRRFCADKGMKDERGCDAVQGARNTLDFIFRNKRTHHTDDRNMVGRFLNAYQAHRRSEYYTGNGRPEPKADAPFKEYIDHAKSRHDKRNSSAL